MKHGGGQETQKTERRDWVGCKALAWQTTNSGLIAVTAYDLLSIELRLSLEHSWSDQIKEIKNNNNKNKDYF